MRDSMRPEEIALVEQIRAELAERRMSQAALAEAIGVEAATMNRYLRGHWQLNLRLYSKIVDALGIEPQELMARALQRLE